MSFAVMNMVTQRLTLGSKNKSLPSWMLKELTLNLILDRRMGLVCRRLEHGDKTCFFSLFRDLVRKLSQKIGSILDPVRKLSQKIASILDPT